MSRKKKLKEPIILEISFEDVEDMKDEFAGILQGENFTRIIKEDLYIRLQEVIEQKADTLIAFRLPSYDADLILEQEQYKKLLERISEIYQEEEDYLECGRIQKLIEEL